MGFPGTEGNKGKGPVSKKQHGTGCFSNLLKHKVGHGTVKNEVGEMNRDYISGNLEKNNG